MGLFYYMIFYYFMPLFIIGEILAISPIFPSGIGEISDVCLLRAKRSAFWPHT